MRQFLTLAVVAALAFLSRAAELPPTYTLPPNELLPGTLEEVKATNARPLDWGAKRIGADKAWAKNPAARGKGVKIAVLDTGCDV
ncbi:MAG: hypothetical protein ACRDD1_18175, partial [Planctomycetia bacterium]